MNGLSLEAVSADFVWSDWPRSFRSLRRFRSGKNWAASLGAFRGLCGRMARVRFGLFPTKAPAERPPTSQYTKFPQNPPRRSGRANYFGSPGTRPSFGSRIRVIGSEDSERLRALERGESHHEAFVVSAITGSFPNLERFPNQELPCQSKHSMLDWGWDIVLLATHSMWRYSAKLTWNPNRGFLKRRFLYKHLASFKFRGLYKVHLGRKPVSML